MDGAVWFGRSFCCHTLSRNVEYFMLFSLLICFQPLFDSVAFVCSVFVSIPFLKEWFGGNTHPRDRREFERRIFARFSFYCLRPIHDICVSQQT